jgi:hypothetical protein
MKILLIMSKRKELCQRGICRLHAKSKLIDTFAELNCFYKLFYNI